MYPGRTAGSAGRKRIVYTAKPTGTAKKARRFPILRRRASVVTGADIRKETFGRLLGILGKEEDEIKVRELARKNISIPEHLKEISHVHPEKRIRDRALELRDIVIRDREIQMEKEEGQRRAELEENPEGIVLETLGRAVAEGNFFEVWRTFELSRDLVIKTLRRINNDPKHNAGVKKMAEQALTYISRTENRGRNPKTKWKEE